MKIKITFNWHKWPIIHEIKLLSIYEFIAYLLALFGCLYIYNSIQEIPLEEDSIYTRDILPIKENHFNATHTDLTIRVPRSSVFKSDSLEKEGINISRYRTQIYGRDSLLSMGNSHEVDSLREVYQAQIPESLCISPNTFVTYYKIEVKHNIINIFSGINIYRREKELSKNRWNSEEGWYSDVKKPDRFMMVKVEYKNNVFFEEAYAPQLSGPETSGGSFGKPAWYSLYDISQSYFKLNLEGDFDQLDIKYDFLGSIELSNIYPFPDVLEMSSFTYTDSLKIEKIKKNGLKFHVKFEEFDKYQNMRLFFITAMLSALFAIFLSFIILSMYKVVIKNIVIEKKKEKSSNTE